MSPEFLAEKAETEASYRERDRGDIPVAMERLSEAVDRCAAHVAKLDGQLSDVLGPDAPRSTTDALTAVSPGTAPLVERLDNLTDRVNATREALVRISERCAL